MGMTVTQHSSPPAYTALKSLSLHSTAAPQPTQHTIRSGYTAQQSYSTEGSQLTQHSSHPFYTSQQSRSGGACYRQFSLSRSGYTAQQSHSTASNGYSINLWPRILHDEQVLKYL